MTIFPGLSSMLIGEDFTFENLRLVPNGEVYLLDFADRFHSPVIRDLAVLISNLNLVKRSWWGVSTSCRMCS
jgi:Ser/Thr protein kinase RdoA (MazF antagonist)